MIDGNALASKSWSAICLLEYPQYIQSNFAVGVLLFIASGLNFDVDEYLKRSPFKPMGIFREGEIPPKGNPKRQPRPDSGFVLLVAQSSSVGIFNEIPEALNFLSIHKRELTRLRTMGVDNMLLDLGVEFRGKLQQAEYVPSELVTALACYGMGLGFSVAHLPSG